MGSQACEAAGYLLSELATARFETEHGRMSPEELGKRAAIIHHRAKALRLQMVPLSKWDKLVAEAERLKRRAYAQSKN